MRSTLGPRVFKVCVVIQKKDYLLWALEKLQGFSSAEHGALSLEPQPLMTPSVGNPLDSGTGASQTRIATGTLSKIKTRIPHTDDELWNPSLRGPQNLNVRSCVFVGLLGS